MYTLPLSYQSAADCWRTASSVVKCRSNTDSFLVLLLRLVTVNLVVQQMLVEQTSYDISEAYHCLRLVFVVAVGGSSPTPAPPLYLSHFSFPHSFPCGDDGHRFNTTWGSINFWLRRIINNPGACSSTNSTRSSFINGQKRHY